MFSCAQVSLASMPNTVLNGGMSLIKTQAPFSSNGMLLLHCKSSKWDTQSKGIWCSWWLQVRLCCSSVLYTLQAGLWDTVSSHSLGTWKDLVHKKYFCGKTIFYLASSHRSPRSFVCSGPLSYLNRCPWCRCQNKTEEGKYVKFFQVFPYKL